MHMVLTYTLHHIQYTVKSVRSNSGQKFEHGKSETQCVPNGPLPEPPGWPPGVPDTGDRDRILALAQEEGVEVATVPRGSPAPQAKAKKAAPGRQTFSKTGGRAAGLRGRCHCTLKSLIEIQ